ncbi:MAG TPA: tRNA lysidine(34) synthetase TilS [Gammaproteobacteria bacterium]|nr:tRNA lysidine(34) synthetase TilS [Gammaproteobacteria bacterium]
MRGTQPPTISKSFSLSILENTLHKTTGIKPDDALCVAFSGGMDSHVLLHALKQLAVDFPFRLRAVHVEHGLHEESLKWADHCASVCGELDVPFTTRHVDVDYKRGDSLEAIARQARYAVLRDEMSQGEFCLTAQHADDQAETVLLQLLRGAGMHGLAGMPAVTEFGRGSLARPFLNVTREALAVYAHEHEFTWVEDPSNRDSRFDRNYLRNEVMPLLGKRWPGVATALSRSARHAATAADMLEVQGESDLTACQMHTSSGDALTIAYLNASLLRRLPTQRQANALRCWIRQHDMKLPSHARLHAAMTDLLVRNKSGQGMAKLPGVSLRLDGDALFLCAAIDHVTQSALVEYAWDPACLLEIPERDLLLKSTPAMGQGCAIKQLTGRQLTVRWRSGGEQCRMAGDFGRKPLRKVFQDLGIPQWRRDEAPLIYIGDELVAVSHYWQNPHFSPAFNERGLVFSVHDSSALQSSFD